MALTRDDLLKIPPQQLRYLIWRKKWLNTAREKQLPPTSTWTELGVLAGRGFGKLLQTSTPIPTPSGWTTMGELRIGDWVFDEAGRPCPVTGVYAPPITQAYRLAFSDGQTLVADADHQWVTWTHRDRKQYARHAPTLAFPENWPSYRQALYNCYGKTVGHIGPEIRSTQGIVDTLTYGWRGDTNHCIPTCGPLGLPVANLPVEPYTLGVWLGDGSSKTGYVTCHPDDQPWTRSAIEAEGYVTRDYPSSAQTFGITMLAPKLRAAGVLGDKHVPLLYLRAAPDQRLALLRGMMDTDGNVKNGSTVAFVNTNRKLIDAVADLVCGLGMKAAIRGGEPGKLNGVEHKPVWRVYFTPTVNPFSLPRKASRLRLNGPQSLRNRHRMIVSAEPLTPEQAGPMRCISVDSPNHMYLAGTGMIPTHNTLMGAQWIANKAYSDPRKLARGVIAPTLNDVRHTCFEGPAGILSVVPPELVFDYNKTNLIITLVDQTDPEKPGAIIRGFSAEEPERLRGPQFADLWCDELAAWNRDEDTWDMAMMGLRLGEKPQVMWTTTPKPRDLVRKLVVAKKERVIVKGSTYDNRANLPQSFFDQLVQYEGTQLGRQELEGELIDSEEGGIIARSWLKLWPSKKVLPTFDWIIMSLDTAFTERTLDKRSHTADQTACTVWGVFWHEDVRAVLLLDCWAEQYGLPDLIKRVKKELNVAYGDDQDRAMIKPLIGSSKMATSGRKPDILLIEDKGSGISLRQMLDREGITSYPYNPGRADKLTRLHMVSHIFAQNKVWVPESENYVGRPKTWVEPMLAQLCSFTGSGSIKHDDFVDSCTQAIRLCMDKNLLDGKRKTKTGEEPYVASPPRVNPYAA